jgi:hypothetical protein
MSTAFSKKAFHMWPRLLPFDFLRTDKTEVSSLDFKAPEANTLKDNTK